MGAVRHRYLVAKKNMVHVAAKLQMCLEVSVVVPHGLAGSPLNHTTPRPD